MLPGSFFNMADEAENARATVFFGFTGYPSNTSRIECQSEAITTNRAGFTFSGTGTR